MRAMESRATKVGNGFALSGQKLWNARLRQATHVVLYTLASNGKPGARTAFLLPIDHPGLQIVDEYRPRIDRQLIRRTEIQGHVRRTRVRYLVKTVMEERSSTNTSLTGD